MDIWKCGICEYVYDPRYGDPGNQVAPGTSYLILPREWACPICGSDKEYFERVEPKSFNNEPTEKTSKILYYL